ncbi:uncharacterized protein LOC132404404 [Hypanus sabinus]|uniref:uncharacterized protein LOC132404404 n=1 Tax=Hypanus sabinus TaxID=79690 RepID=UPI0028C50FEA|nr:uncharacterized protein LOC132404404 [Hypanus sabinus]
MSCKLMLQSLVVLVLKVPDDRGESCVSLVEGSAWCEKCQSLARESSARRLREETTPGTIGEGEDMTAKLIQCAMCMMWEVRDTVGAPGCYSCGKCVQIQLLKEHVAALKKELDNLRFICENESFLDRTYREVVTLRIPEERKGATMRKERMLEVQETPGDLPLINRFILLEAVRTEDTASLRGGQVCELKIGAEAEPRSQTSGRVMVVGDSIVRGKI